MDLRPKQHSGDMVAAFFQAGSRLEFQKGQTIIRGDDAPTDIYYIETGMVRACATNKRGEDYTLVALAPNEIFPLAWLTAEVRRQIFFEAAVPTSVYRRSQADVMKALETDQKFCYLLLMQTLSQYTLVIDRLDNLEYKYASERLVYRLLYLTSRFGKKQTDGTYLLTVPISQQMIASSINASRESVSREFERLVKKEYVRFQGKHIAILNVEGLKQEFPSPLSPDWWGL